MKIQQVSYDVIIVGAGPAGLSAAVYCGRRRLKTLILSKDLGGQTALSSDIENYLGYHLLSGAELITKFQEHLKDFDIEIKIGTEVKGFSGKAPQFTVETADASYAAKTLILASGKEPRHLGIPGEQEYRGKGVTYCATCDAPFFKDKIVAVVGGGNSALDAVLQLLSIAKQIYLININSEFGTTSDTVMLDKVRASNKVEILLGTTAKMIQGETTVTGLVVENNTTKKMRTLLVAGIFIEIGSIPSVAYAPSTIRKNKWNEIEINEDNMTTIPGVFAAGDVTNEREKQVIIAAGEGAKAALDASEFLATHHFAEVQEESYI